MLKDGMLRDGCYARNTESECKIYITSNILQSFVYTLCPFTSHFHFICFISLQNVLSKQKHNIMAFLTNSSAD